MSCCNFQWLQKCHRKISFSKLEKFNWAIFWITLTKNFPGARHGITMKVLEVWQPWTNLSHDKLKMNSYVQIGILHYFKCIKGQIQKWKLFTNNHINYTVTYTCASFIQRSFTCIQNQFHGSAKKYLAATAILATANKTESVQWKS